MNRRGYLKAMLVAGGGAVAARAASPKGPIQLHLDMSVPPEKEKEMFHIFETVFRPAAAKQPGYIDVKILKLRTVIQGKPPADGNYRFVLTYQSEELRQKWIATDVHQKVWPMIENLLTTKNYPVLIYDVD